MLKSICSDCTHVYFSKFISMYFLFKIVTRSKQDQNAVELLEAKTVHIKEGGVLHYAAPLFSNNDGTDFHADKEAVLNLKHPEKRLKKQPAKIHQEQIQKLLDADM